MIKNPLIIIKVVEEMGGTIEKIIPERSYFCININNEKIFISRKFEIASDFISGKMLTAHKDLTYVVLKKNNIPTPNSVCFYRKTINATDTEKKLSSLSYPIVIKDSNGSNSKGVFTNIKSVTEATEVILNEIKKNFLDISASSPPITALEKRFPVKLNFLGGTGAFSGIGFYFHWKVICAISIAPDFKTGYNLPNHVKNPQ